MNGRSSQTQGQVQGQMPGNLPADNYKSLSGRGEIVRQRLAQIGVAPRLDPAMRQAFGGEAALRLTPPFRDDRGCAHAAAFTMSS